MLTDSPAEARAVAAELRQAMQTRPLSEMVARVRTLDDMLPADQSERQDEIARIRKKLTPSVRRSLTDEQRSKVDQFLGQDGTPTIELGAIPPTLLKGLQERDGLADKAVLVYPKLTAGLWDGPRNEAFVTTLRTIARVPETMGGKAARLAGGPPLTADIVASMRHDGSLASVLAFFAVVLTVAACSAGAGITIVVYLAASLLQLPPNEKQPLLEAETANQLVSDVLRLYGREICVLPRLVKISQEDSSRAAEMN